MKTQAVVLFLVLSACVSNALEVIRGPYSQLVTHESALIVFRADVSASFSVYYGTTPASMNHSCAAILDQRAFWDAWEDNVYVARLEGLQPATRYYYKVISGAYEYTGIDSMLFTTAPVRGTGTSHFRCMSESDLIGGYSASDTLLINDCLRQYNPMPELWIADGDLEQDHGCMSMYNDGSWWEPFRPIIQKTTIFASFGNHDGMCSEDDATGAFGDYWYGAWYMPHNDYDSSEAYYSFYYGNTKFIYLYGLPVLRDGAAYQWLVKELSDTTPVWKIIVSHFPNYFSATDQGHQGLATRGIKTYDSLCQMYGVDLMINGHIGENFRSPLMTVDSVFGYRLSPAGSNYTKTRHGPGTFYISTAVNFSQRQKFTLEINGNVMTGVRKRYGSGSYTTMDQWTITKTMPTNEPPVAAICAPENRSHATIGEAIVLRGTGGDHEDGILGSSALQWSYSIDRADGTPIQEETIIQGIGLAGQFTPIVSGYYTIKLTVTDNGGAVNTEERKVYVTEPLTDTVRIDFGTHSAFTSPAGWTNVTTQGWSGSFEAPDRSYWGNAKMPYDIPSCRFVRSNSTAVWNYPLTNGLYYVSVRCGATYTRNGDPLDNRVARVRVEGQSILENARFYYGLGEYAFAYTDTSIFHAICESAPPITRGKPASVSFWPVQIADNNLTLQLDTALISDIIIYRADTTFMHINEHSEMQNAGLSVWPNPFNPVIMINIKTHGRAFLQVYDINGKYVKDLTRQIVNGSVVWDASQQPSGVYVVRVCTGKSVIAHKITLLK